jgi:hypothetical protein
MQKHVAGAEDSVPDLMRESMGSLSGHPVAEGATAPESLRPKDRIMGRHSGKRTGFSVPPKG